MALRSLGSSLVAKSTPGSASRDLLEKQISKPAIPGKGEIGTTSRDLVSEPQVVAAAPGSEKIVAAGPGVEGSQVISPTEATPTQPMQPLLAGAMGLPQGPGQAGSNNMAMMDGNAGRVAASAPTTGGRTASARSGGPVAGSSVAGGNISVPGASTSVAAPRSMDVSPTSPSLANVFSSRVSADQPTIGPMPVGQEVNRGLFGTSSSINPLTGQVMSATKTAGQVLAGAAGKVLSSIPATSNIGNKLQAFGGSSTASASGKGSVSNVLRSIGTGASNVVSKLRSLFGKR